MGEQEKMVRNWDMIREILVRFEEKSSEEKALQLRDWPEDTQLEISYNVEQLIEAGLLHGRMVETLGPGPSDFIVFRLSWEGHDFLDAIKNDTVWNKTKETFVSKGISMTFDLVKSVAINFVRRMISE
jgi:hypothetical protein